MCVLETIRELQTYQRDRCTCVHHDISRLPYPERIKHLTFHLARYVAALAHGTNRVVFIQTVVDVFIISLSAADVLEIDLSRVVRELSGDIAKQSTMLDLGLAIRERESKSDMTEESYFRDLTVINGQMAAACEAIDHGESVYYRGVLCEPVVELFRITVMAAAAFSAELATLAAIRWQEIDTPRVCD